MFVLMFVHIFHINICAWLVKWSDVRPSMVNHTRNLCSSFNPSKCTHTPWAVGSQCYGAQGAVGGSVSCSRVYWGWIECWWFTPPPTNPAGPETWTRDLRVRSLTLYPLGLTMRPISLYSKTLSGFCLHPQFSRFHVFYYMFFAWFPCHIYLESWFELNLQNCSIE